MPAEDHGAGVAYRRIVLDRLSSPEQLDQSMEVTRLRGWLALLGLALLLVVAGIWSIFGAIPTQISAAGMLIRPGGLFEVSAPDQGNIAEVRVSEGQMIGKGETVATLEEPALTVQLEEIKKRLDELRQNVEQRAEAARATPAPSSRAAATTTASAHEHAALERDQQTLAALTEQAKRSNVIQSPYSGRILEIKVRPGDLVSRGAKILSLQLSDRETGGLQAVVYVPSANGKSVAPGMSVQVSPSTAAREEYGYLLGTVTYVSEFPATREGMMRVLGNENLVTSLSSEGPPFAVYADLHPDPSAAGGYRWSSRKGAALSVNSGTPCEVFITIREQHPIELVFPLIRMVSGL